MYDPRQIYHDTFSMNRDVIGYIAWENKEDETIGTHNNNCISDVTILGIKEHGATRKVPNMNFTKA